MKLLAGVNMCFIERRHIVIMSSVPEVNLLDHLWKELDWKVHKRTHVKKDVRC